MISCQYLNFQLSYLVSFANQFMPLSPLSHFYVKKARPFCDRILAPRFLSHLSKVLTCRFSPRSVQFSSVAQSCLTLCNPMNHSTPGLPVHHQLPEFIQTHVHRVGDTIQPSHPLSSPSPPAPNPSQDQGFFQWVNSLHEMAKVLEFQLQHRSFKWIYRTDLL